MKRVLFAVVTAMSAIAPCIVRAQDRGANAPLSAGIAAPTDRIRVLWVAAHPDDEDTQLLTWLSRSGRAEAAYLSLTRGDGGQNLIGNELGEELGIIRTEELLAARRVDGAHQFFTRAYDFGYSKSAEETYAHWPKDSVMNDVVTVVRAWRPHIIITMFSGTPRDGHGQHQVSAVLAKEAYAVAGDTVRYPVRTFGPAWSPLKLYETARFQPDSATIRFNVGEYNPDLRRSYAEVAGESRSQHKSQGFGALQRRGVVWNYLKRIGTRVNEATSPSAERSIFDGLPVPAAASVTSAFAEIAPHVALEAFADRRYLAVGDSARVTATLYNRSRQTIRVTPGSGGNLRLVTRPDRPLVILPDSSARWELYLKGSEISQPWW